MEMRAHRDTALEAGRGAETTHTLARVREECAKALAGTHIIVMEREREGRRQRAAPAGMWAWRTPCPTRPAPDSPFSLCWKEGENSLAVILAIRASSWAF